MLMQVRHEGRVSVVKFILQVLQLVGQSTHFLYWEFSKALASYCVLLQLLVVWHTPLMASPVVQL